MNPHGIKTHIGLHYLAPPRNWTAVYTERLEGETKLVLQEQLEEDKSKLDAKNLDLYHFGRMGTVAELYETFGNFYGMMHTIIEFKPDAPPDVWKEIIAFDKLLRSKNGKSWAMHHHKMREAVFNVLQDVQSTISGYVAVARTSGYKTALQTGKAIAAKAFSTPKLQGTELRCNLSAAITMMTAGTYKDIPQTFLLFQPPPPPNSKNRAPKTRARSPGFGNNPTKTPNGKPSQPSKQYSPIDILNYQYQPGGHFFRDYSHQDISSNQCSTIRNPTPAREDQSSASTPTTIPTNRRQEQRSTSQSQDKSFRTQPKVTRLAQCASGVPMKADHVPQNTVPTTISQIDCRQSRQT